MFKCWCGESVKNSWSHLECAVEDTVKNDKGTALYKIVCRDYPELVKKYEKGD